MNNDGYIASAPQFRLGKELKRHCITLTTMALVAGAAQGQSAVTIYGNIDAALELSNQGNGTQQRIVSGSPVGSRLGFKGSEELGGGLRAIFNLEMGFTADDGVLGQGGRIFGREAAVGLASSTLGTLQVGRLNTPYFYAEFTGDAFSRAGTGGTLSLTRNGANGNFQVFPQGIAGRADNSVAYTTPSIGGFIARALVSTGESSPAIGRQVGLSGQFIRGPLELAAALSHQKAGTAGGGALEARYIGGFYNFGTFKLYSGYKSEKNACGTCTGGFARVPGLTGLAAAEFREYNVGVRVPFGPVTILGQATRIQDRSEYLVGPGSRDANWLSAGAEYNFSKRTMVYTYLGTIGNKNGSSYAVASGTQQLPANSVAGNARASTLDIGVFHRF